MKVKNGKEEIKGPNTLVISGYTNTYDFAKIITPNLKRNEYNLIEEVWVFLLWFYCEFDLPLLSKLS